MYRMFGSFAAAWLLPQTTATRAE